MINETEGMNWKKLKNDWSTINTCVCVCVTSNIDLWCHVRAVKSYINGENSMTKVNIVVILFPPTVIYLHSLHLPIYVYIPHTGNRLFHSQRITTKQLLSWFSILVYIRKQTKNAIRFFRYNFTWKICHHFIFVFKLDKFYYIYIWK